MTGLSVYFPTCLNCSQGYYENKWKDFCLNPSREQAGFRKGYSTVNHLQTINQLIGKCNDIKRPLCIGYIDYEKAFDSIEHEAIFKALTTIGTSETCITILKGIYTGATARAQMEDIVSEEISTQRGVRQGDPISTKLFTATIQEEFKMPS